MFSLVFLLGFPVLFPLKGGVPVTWNPQEDWKCVVGKKEIVWRLPVTAGKKSPSKKPTQMGVVQEAWSLWLLQSMKKS